MTQLLKSVGRNTSTILSHLTTELIHLKTTIQLYLTTPTSTIYYWLVCVISFLFRLDYSIFDFAQKYVRQHSGLITQVFGFILVMTKPVL